MLPDVRMRVTRVMSDESQIRGTHYMIKPRLKYGRQNWLGLCLSMPPFRRAPIFSIPHRLNFVSRFNRKMTELVI